MTIKQALLFSVIQHQGEGPRENGKDKSSQPFGFDQKSILTLHD